MVYNTESSFATGPLIGSTSHQRWVLPFLPNIVEEHTQCKDYSTDSFDSLNKWCFLKYFPYVLLPFQKMIKVAKVLISLELSTSQSVH